MNRSTPARGYAVAGISGLALILIMLLFAWFGFPNASGIDAFKAFHDWVLFFLIFTAFAGMALALVGSSTRVDLPVALSAIATALGVISFLILIIYLISPPSYSVAGPVGTASVSLGRKVGIWFGLIAVAGVAIGGYMAMQEEGTSFGVDTDGFRTTGSEGTPPSESGPPPPSTEP